ncbi:unnamed protein product [Closterium sp. Naga37s-1]|nr:unnamed protein product [Closterium sp. Naga37s-1]
MSRQHVRGHPYHEAQRPHPAQGSSAVPVTGGERAAAAAARAGGAEAARPVAGNLESFLAHVTPHVKLRFLPKVPPCPFLLPSNSPLLPSPYTAFPLSPRSSPHLCTPRASLLRHPRAQDWCDEHSNGARAKAPPGAPAAAFFALSDLWDALEECSAYSAAVPLHLPPTGAPATQHYAPSISGLQLFSRLPASAAGPPAPRLHSCSPLEQPSLASSPHSPHYPHSPHSPHSPQSPHSPPSPWEAYLEEGGNGRCEEGAEAWCRDCSGGRPLLEFFERAPPHCRPPLYTKVAELERECAVLRRTSSLQLHPRSWIAIAWYPVYSIPTAATTRDLSASFLTFHSLSSPLPSSSGSCSLCRARFWIAPPSLPVFQSAKHLPARPSSDSADGASEGRQRGVFTTPLVPFGFAGYKTWGTVWSDRGAVRGLEVAATQWLRQIDANLPDHAFFSRQR